LLSPVFHFLPLLSVREVDPINVMKSLRPVRFMSDRPTSVFVSWLNSCISVTFTQNSGVAVEDNPAGWQGLND
jgi:hypothetical protein